MKVSLADHLAKVETEPSSARSKARRSPDQSEELNWVRKSMLSASIALDENPAPAAAPIWSVISRAISAKA